MSKVGIFYFDGDVSWLMLDAHQDMGKSEEQGARCVERSATSRNLLRLPPAVPDSN